MSNEFYKNLAIKVIMSNLDYSDCPWMKYAIAELGVKETPGDQDTPRVVEYLETVGFKKDSTPWCSAFVSWCMKNAGHERTLEEAKKAGVSAAGAKSWLRWGVPLSAPRFGAVTVFERPPKPEQGHVGFYIGTLGEQILLLGGNQEDEVNISLQDKKLWLGYRWRSLSLAEQGIDKIGSALNSFGLF